MLLASDSDVTVDRNRCAWAFPGNRLRVLASPFIVQVSDDYRRSTFHEACANRCADALRSAGDGRRSPR
jgi:hypothetical protein